jgi:hypothetical protein
MIEERSPEIEEARRIQELLGMSDQVFAESVLHFSASYWSLLKQGDRTGRGYKFMRGLERAREALSLALRSSSGKALEEVSAERR